jgi:hypothetical protein
VHSVVEEWTGLALQARRRLTKTPGLDLAEWVRNTTYFINLRRKNKGSKFIVSQIMLIFY